jgi:hypothetical protein
MKDPKKTHAELMAILRKVQPKPPAKFVAPTKSNWANARKPYTPEQHARAMAQAKSTADMVRPYLPAIANTILDNPHSTELQNKAMERIHQMQSEMPHKGVEGMVQTVIAKVRKSLGRK